MIIDSMKHLPPSVNSYRTVLPGQPYVPAPPQEKLDPFELDEKEFLALLPEWENAKQVVGKLSGFSPIHGEELLHRLKDEAKEDAYRTYKEFLSSFKGGTLKPTIAEVGNKTIYSAASLTYADKTVATFETLGELLDKVYFARAERERVKSQAADLERWLDNEIAKLKLKMEKLGKEQKAAEKLDTFQLYGELLTANSYAINKGDTEAVVDNYYEEGTTVTIPLDPRKTPIENAQRLLFTLYKGKKCIDHDCRTVDESKRGHRLF